MPLGRRKLPTPVLSGSGSRVFLSPTRAEHPCFNNSIEAPQAGDWQIGRAFLSAPIDWPTLRACGANEFR